MPLTPETEAEILRRHHADHWPAGTIAMAGHYRFEPRPVEVVA